MTTLQGKRPLMSAPYVPWKSDKSVQYGVGEGHVRPTTNKDYTNISFAGKFGRPRPLKHYRKGRIIVTVQLSVEADRLANRQVTAGTTGSTIASMMDRPGATSFSSDGNACTNCPGTRIVSSYLSNPDYLENNQTAELREQMQNSGVCFNAEKKARLRCRPANTLISGAYYTTLEGFRKARCKTFAQQSFNFSEETVDEPHTFLANCAGVKTCRRVTYKPNNTPFATQGAVDSGLQTFKLSTETTTTTISDKNKKFPYGNCCSVQQAVN